jgi:hypothetical protein
MKIGSDSSSQARIDPHFHGVGFCPSSMTVRLKEPAIGFSFVVMKRSPTRRVVAPTGPEQTKATPWELVVDPRSSPEKAKLTHSLPEKPSRTAIPWRLPPRELCRPFTACPCRNLVVPKRYPGLICCGPFGASFAWSARFCRVNRISIRLASAGAPAHGAGRPDDCDRLWVRISNRAGRTPRVRNDARLSGNTPLPQEQRARPQ